MKGEKAYAHGLVRQNNRDRWIRHAALAEIVTSKVRHYADGVAAGG